jgi:serine/threonine protein kinase
MTPEHLARVERIFEAALALPAAERDAFLKSECGADERLREQAEQALRDHDSDSSEFASAVGSLAAQVAAEHSVHGAGTRVGSYELISPLGRGGMGEVWLAEDTRLGRKVAIKFLLDAFSAGRVERFDQEARAASALNHPNILTVHEFGDEGGRHYIVTEYVEGHTVREMLTRGPLGAAQAVDLPASGGASPGHGAPG